MIQAIIEMRRGNPDEAIKLLQLVSRYDGDLFTEFWPIYLRGQAYLQQRAGGEAAAEFQKIVNTGAERPILSCIRWRTWDLRAPLL